MALSRRAPGRTRLGYADAISAPSYCGHRVPAAIIRHAIWPDLRFILGYRDVEVLPARFGNGRNGASLWENP